MLLQGMVIAMVPAFQSFAVLALLSGLLGLGTALVYPTFLSGIAKASSPAQRAESIGTFRLWRDSGYAFGAILSGLTADWLGLKAAIITVGIITIISALIVRIRMDKWL
jgi:MFS family permease